MHGNTASIGQTCNSARTVFKCLFMEFFLLLAQDKFPTIIVVSTCGCYRTTVGEVDK